MCIRDSTGPITHSYSAGIEYSDEKTHRGSYVVSPAVGYNGSAACVPAVVGAASNYDCTSFTNPNPNDPWMSLHTVTRSNRALDVQQQNTTKSAYVFDTLELNPQWLLNMGLRWDDYSAVLTTPSATAAPTVLRNDNNFVNYQAGVVYKPTQNGSIYLSWGTSSTPPGMDGGDGADGITAAIQNLKPQETTNVELGVKWNLFDNQLNLTTEMGIRARAARLRCGNRPAIYWPVHMWPRMTAQATLACLRLPPPCKAAASANVCWPNASALRATTGTCPSCA